jgi:hypothetical protein
MKSDDGLLAESAEATDGLMMMSESDYPFVPFRWNTGTEITPESLRALAQESAASPVTEQNIDEFFRAVTSEPDWKGADDLKLARRYQSLVRLLKENLAELKVYRVGAVNISVYIIGRSNNGTWLGLSTKVIET